MRCKVNSDGLLKEDDDFNTAPLSGLCPSPWHLMSLEEKRAHVTRIRQMRQSFQVFKSEVEEVEKERAVRVKKPKTKESTSLNGMEELF
jgi:hypothetical protein